MDFEEELLDVIFLVVIDVFLMGVLSGMQEFAFLLDGFNWCFLDVSSADRV